MAAGERWITKQTIVGLVVAVLGSVIAGYILLPGGLLSRPHISISDPTVTDSTDPDSVIESQEQFGAKVTVVNDGNGAAVDCSATWYNETGVHIWSNPQFSIRAGESRDPYANLTAPSTTGVGQIRVDVSCPTRFLIFTSNQTDSENLSYTIHAPQ